MSFLKSRQISTPPTGMSAGEWLEARRKERSGEDSQNKSKKYDFLDDSSSEESFSASNFLKKVPPKEVPSSKQPLKQQASAPERPKTSHGLADHRSSSAPSRGSSALSRFSQLEKDILARQNKPTVNVFSSSDMDMDISSDSEIKRDMFSLRKNLNVPKTTQNYVEEVSYQDDSRSKTESILSDRRPSATKKKVVSFASNLVETLHSESDDVSLDEFLPERFSDDASLDDILPQPKVIMSLSDLQPAVQMEDEPDLLQLHTVDELLYESDASKRTRSDSEVSVQSDSNLFNVQSLEELVPTQIPSKFNEVSTPTKKKTETVIAKEKTKEDEYDYSEDFASDDDTLKDTDSISEELEEEIKTESVSTIPESISTEKGSEEEKSVSYTQTFDSISSRDLTSSAAPPLTPRAQSAAVQTDPVEIGSILLEEKLFPKLTESEQTFFKPSQVINNEALSVLSAYSPAVLAVQEMLKQQLAFTRDFITRSERLHKAAAETLIPDYQYATLEEARQIINQQRQKLKLPPKYPTTS